MDPNEQLVADLTDQIARSTVLSSPAMPGQLARLLAGEFVTVTTPKGARMLATRTGVPVAEAIRAKLASPDYAHFVKPNAQAGDAVLQIAAHNKTKGIDPMGGFGQLSSGMGGASHGGGIGLGRR